MSISMRRAARSLRAATCAAALAVATHAGAQAYDVSADGRAYLQVYSAFDARDAIVEARLYADVFPETRVFLTDQGAYAVVVALGDIDAVDALRREAVQFSAIPQDSFLRPGRRFRRVAWAPSLGASEYEPPVADIVEGAEEDGPDVIDGAEGVDYGFAAEGAFEGYGVQVGNYRSADAGARAVRRARARFPNARLFETEAGRFAVLVAINRSEAAARRSLRELIAYGDAPGDSFVRPGSDFIAEIAVDR